MSNLPRCPICTSDSTYEDGDFYVCPECGHEWPRKAAVKTNDKTNGKSDNESGVVKDAYGTVLKDGDSVTIIKDLKVKGASSSLKVGTRVKNIRLVDGDHNIDCKIDGFGQMSLKSEFVKKA